MKGNINLKPQTLELLGLSQKDLDVYVALLRLGTAPLRRAAEEAGYNRGTTYDALKRLMSAGLVSFVDAKAHRYFTAEDPQKLRGLATRREVAIQEARQKLDDLLPDLRSIAGEASYRPAVRYFEGEVGVREILKDVIRTTEKTRDKTYRIYSSDGIRQEIYECWPGYTKTRVKHKVKARAIGLGEGGKLAGLDERKWLTKKSGAAAYIFIYGHKTAYISLDDHKRLFGVIIDDINTTSTHSMIFDMLWRLLPDAS